MGLVVKQGDNKQGELIPEGIHEAICYGVVDIGTHTIDFKGHQKDRHKAVIMWEIPSLRINYKKDDVELEGPKVMSKTYTLSFYEKANLRKDLESWRGKKLTNDELDGFDLKNILGVPCQLQVMHAESKSNGKTYANINMIIGSPNSTIEKSENEHIWFSFDEGSEIPDAVYGWLKEKIEDSHEWKSLQRSGSQEEPEMAEAPPEDEDDGLPF